MNLKYLPLINLCLLLGVATAAEIGHKLPDTVSFNAHIRPLMSNTCFACHGPDEAAAESDFRIDSFESATGPLPSDDERVGIVPGNLQASEVYLRITGASDGQQMPPPEFRHQLSDYDKALFARWIEQGAQYAQHWSYAPIVRPEVPSEGVYADEVVNAIDNFVLARLEREGIKPSELAEKSALLRRLSLDLIGLPPTPEELRAFLADESDDAYSAQVERLLASKHYGERMAIAWLDIVRFSDTVGYHGDQNQRIFPYRDYVIDSFNSNKPFDVFTREQLAGDLLHGADGNEPTPEQLTATGLLRLNLVTREGGAQPGEYLAKYKADRVRALGTAWLGSTLACCECHNHKYDPFTTKDFYSFGAFFDDLRQWGVYSDYGYTPNADLKGFNNDYPFPPETRLQSESLAREIEKLCHHRDRDLFAQLGKKSLETELARKWIGDLTKLVKSHADGWQPLQIESAVASGTSHDELLADGSLLISGEQSKGEKHLLTAKVNESMWVNSIRMRVLPDERNGGFVGRGEGGRFSVNVSAKLADHVEAEKTRPRPLRPQFVRIELPGKQKILSLAEVQVFVESENGELENIALQGKATQISTYRRGEAEHAIDGNTEGDYHKAYSVTHNNETNDPWWEVDLSGSFKIAKIVLWNRTDGDFGKRLSNYRVVLLDSNRRELFALSPETPSPSLEIDSLPDSIVHDSGQPLEFAWVEADRSNPSRYDSGAPPRTISGAWNSGPTRWQYPDHETSLTHTAVYHLAEPVLITPDHQLQLNIESADIGRVHFSVTPIGQAIAGWPAVSNALRRAVTIPKSTLSQKDIELLVSAVHRSTLPVSEQLATSRRYRDAILECHSGLAMSLIVQAVAENEIPVSRVRPRGNWQDDSGALAPPAFPEFLPHDNAPANDRLTRLDLANWLTSKSNPLTPRHFANRTWKQFLGNGLSAKLDDLGNQGEWPSHPELLDWLASEFVASGWDTKHLVRLIVNSRTYRQAAAVREELAQADPYNRLLAQQSPRRLEAEMIRDNALAIAGLLQAEYVGGPSVFPYQPDGHYNNIQFPDRTYTASSDYRQYRRGVYMHWQRTFLHPMLVNFDAPTRDECTADRPLSNSPQQALTLLNDPQFVEAAHAFAERLLSENPGAEFDSLLTVAFLRAVAREPSAQEREALASLYRRQLEYYNSNASEAEKLVTVGNHDSVAATDLASLAALSQVCRVILNLHETITRF